MNFFNIPLNPTPRMLRQFSAAWIVCFLALAFRYGVLRHSPVGFWLALVSLVGIIGFPAPRALYWPFVVLSAAASPIGWVMAQLILALMFYILLTPVALFFRWRGRDALQLKKRQQLTFWVDRQEQPAPEEYLKQF